MERKWQLVTFGAVHALILVVVFDSGLYDTKPLTHDIAVYFEYASNIVLGQLPYRDFIVEYPPLALLFFILPRLVTSELSIYQHVFVAEILLFDLLGLFLVSILARRLDLRLANTLTIYTVMLLAIGPILIYRYDLIPAIMVLLSLYAFNRQKHKVCWVMLALGTMTKIYPVIIAPLFLIHQFCQHQYRRIIPGIITFTLTIGIISLPGLLLNPGGFWQSFLCQAQRGLHADSTYSSFLLFGKTLGLSSVRIVLVDSTLFSVDVVSPAADMLATISPVIMVMALGIIFWFFYRDQQARSNLKSPSSHLPNIINYSFLTILVLLLTSKVFSPQFIIWLYPLVTLITGPWRQASWLLFTLVSVLTQYIFPQHYREFTRGNIEAIDILLGRNILLMALACLHLSPRPVMSQPKQADSQTTVKLTEN